ncbi:MAG: hypothetical protein DRQ88_10265 [Epsilonproteobacteria bacterium]|nr:MAG: hypothetical protein DRQ88_10265 [Campylobacterota bacterium]
MAEFLKKWAVLDIETTGIDANYDCIIDVGFLQFEGVKLVKKYSSLVKNLKTPLPHFIQKLTSISQEMLDGAPSWDRVEPEVLELYGHKIIAHNASFEKSFLDSQFEKIDDGEERESFEDSMFFLSILFPEKHSLGLEKWLYDFNIADNEKHRGFEDSLDLLRVMLVGVELVREDREKYEHTTSLFRKYLLEDYWFYHFLNLTPEETRELAEQIDFNLDLALSRAKESESGEMDLDSKHSLSLEFTGENIKHILQNEEELRPYLPGYRYRKSQEELALKTGQSFKNEIHSMIQAPTGTGKTLGYLLPSALFCLGENEKILVATGTKALQHQALTKDVPDLYKLLGIGKDELKIKKLVGSQNHLCELLFRKENEDFFSQVSLMELDEKLTELYFEMAFFHNSRSPSEKQILREDIPYVLKKKIDGFDKREGDIKVDFRSCAGSQCQFKADCTYISGIKEAKEADIIIGNHALMYSWPRSFSRPEYIVVDEAHKIENETTDAFSYEISTASLKNLIKNLTNFAGIGSLFYLLAQNESSKGESSPTINRLKEFVTDKTSHLEELAKTLNEDVENFFKKLPRFTEFYWNECPMIDDRAQDALGLRIYSDLETLNNVLGGISDIFSPYLEQFDLKALKNDNDINALTKFITFMGGLDDMLNSLTFGLSKNSDYTTSLKFHAEYGLLVKASPIDVGKKVYEGLLQESKSVVFTSATLGSKGSKGVEWELGYLYLDSDKRFKAPYFLSPIYDYENNTKIFVCDDVPALYDNTFVGTVLGPITKLVRELGGRSLLLFSAKTRFETAREILIEQFEGEIPLFIQGMGSHVVEDFKNADQGILIGMEAFGEGIDIPGDSLMFIFIDKIPDLRMDLVIQNRRDFYEKSFGNEFSDYYLSHRARGLHQKLGRLLRTENDRGGVIIVDSRIKRWKGRTTEKFFKLMTPYKIKKSSLDNACLEIKDFVQLPESTR